MGNDHEGLRRILKAVAALVEDARTGRTPRAHDELVQLEALRERIVRQIDDERVASLAEG